MKPTKNRVFCNNCHRVKMLFPTQDKADNFIRFNAKDIAENNDKVPVRSYFCPACGGWHVTHREKPGGYARTDEQNEKAFRLGLFVSSLKKNFDKKEWKKWKASLAEYRQQMEVLEHLAEHRLFLLEAKRQFDHYDKLVAAGEKEETKKNNVQLNGINAERKSLCTEIRVMMKDLNLKDCKTKAERLMQLMAHPAFDMSEKKIKEECRDMVDCFMDGVNLERLETIVNTVQFLNGRMNYIPTKDLEEMVNTMTENYTLLTCGTKHRKFLQTLQDRVKKCQKYLQERLDYKDGVTQMDKALQLMDNHYDTIRKSLIDAVSALQENNNDLAVEYLTMADNRLKAVPVSRRKMEMMKHLVAVAEKTVLD